MNGDVRISIVAVETRAKMLGMVVGNCQPMVQLETR